MRTDGTGVCRHRWHDWLSFRATWDAAATHTAPPAGPRSVAGTAQMSQSRPHCLEHAWVNRSRLPMGRLHHGYGPRSRCNKSTRVSPIATSPAEVFAGLPPEYRAHRGKDQEGGHESDWRRSPCSCGPRAADGPTRLSPACRARAWCEVRDVTLFLVLVRRRMLEVPAAT